MPKPDNPYEKNSKLWSLMEGSWEDLTAAEIAEVLGTTHKSVLSMCSQIKRETGYSVPRSKAKRGRKQYT